MRDPWRVALAELIGTFLLVFVAASAATLSSAGVLDLTGLGLATGLAYGVVVAMMVPISGGHVNPAVSIALWVAGRLSPVRLAFDLVAQLVGAVLAAFLVRFLFPGPAFDSAASTMAFAPLTGAALNPARWFGTAVASGVFADWYVWIVGPIAGGIIG